MHPLPTTQARVRVVDQHSVLRRMTSRGRPTRASGDELDLFIAYTVNGTVYLTDQRLAEIAAHVAAGRLPEDHLDRVLEYEVTFRVKGLETLRGRPREEVRKELATLFNRAQREAEDTIGTDPDEVLNAVVPLTSPVSKPALEQLPSAARRPGIQVISTEDLVTGLQAHWLRQAGADAHGAGVIRTTCPAGCGTGSCAGTTPTPPTTPSGRSGTPARRRRSWLTGWTPSRSARRTDPPSGTSRTGGWRRSPRTSRPAGSASRGWTTCPGQPTRGPAT